MSLYVIEFMSENLCNITCWNFFLQIFWLHKCFHVMREFQITVKPLVFGIIFREVFQFWGADITFDWLHFQTAKKIEYEPCFFLIYSYQCDILSKHVEKPYFCVTAENAFDFNFFWKNASFMIYVFEQKINCIYFFSSKTYLRQI